MAIFGYSPGQIQPASQAKVLGWSDSVPFWAPDSAPEEFEIGPWDTVWVGGERLPGKAVVRSARQAKIDERDAAGNDGQTLTFLGRTSSEILIRLSLWTERQLSEWHRIKPSLSPPPGKMSPEALDVYHPGLALNDVKSMYCLDVGVLMPTGTPGVFETELRFVEFLPSKKVEAPATPLASKSTAKQGTGKPQRLAKPSEGEHAP